MSNTSCVTKTIGAEIEYMMKVATENGLHYTAEFLQHAAIAAKREIAIQREDEKDIKNPLSEVSFVH